MTSTEGRPRPAPRVVIAVALVGFCGAWNAGNVGPVASVLAKDFDVSLAAVGVLSGSLFLGSMIVGLLFAARFGERVGVTRGLQIGCWTVAAGNLIFAVSPIFAGLAVGRVLPGLGFAVINTLGAVWAREVGGARLLGVFGGAIQAGIACALLLGSGLNDLGVDWRVGFVVASLLAVAGALTVPGRHGARAERPPHVPGFLGAAVRRVRVYRLAMMFTALFGVPLILGSWLIEYLTRDGDVRSAIAGAISFVLFVLSAVLRVVGGSLRQRGLPHAWLTGALLLAAVGLGGIAFDPTTAVAFGGVVLLGTGLGVPYATALSEAEDLFPDAPSEPLALLTLVSLLLPVIVIPFIGQALEAGRGQIAFVALAVFLLLATLANLKRAGIPLPVRARG
ncbi:MFS transporter [Agromyces sp. SYSU T00194]|uniref:MFS transporter n=1 Tax=Agromyces chitinivorans TaxID=3158560 RepID=UPI003397B4BB